MKDEATRAATRTYRALGRRFAYLKAYVWRRLLFRTKFIVVAGSVGKTTAKNLLAAVLVSQQPTLKTKACENAISNVVQTILRVRPWHRFAVIECGIDRPQSARSHIRLVKPNLLVMTRITRSHIVYFGSIEAIAEEKSDFVRGLGRRDLVVLNGDDERVRAMSQVSKAKAIFFGSDPEFDVWADQLSSKWPKRFACRVHSKGQSQITQTQLIGSHWYCSVLAAITAGVTLGVPLAEASAAVASVEPLFSRLQAVRLSCGATILRDEKDGAIDTFEKAFEVMREATAARKLAVIGDCTDRKGNSKMRFRYLAKQVAAFAELAIFVGEHSHHAVKAATYYGMSEQNVRSVLDVDSAAQALQSTLQPDDLVLLKGRKSQRLARVFFLLNGSIGCDVITCKLSGPCDSCPQLQFIPQK